MRLLQSTLQAMYVFSGLKQQNPRPASWAIVSPVWHHPHCPPQTHSYSHRAIQCFRANPSDTWEMIHTVWTQCWKMAGRPRTGNTTLVTTNRRSTWIGTISQCAKCNREEIHHMSQVHQAIPVENGSYAKLRPGLGLLERDGKNSWE